MNIAELFVRVRGDTTDVTTKLRGVEGSLLRVERSAGLAHLSTGKLRQEMLTLARQVTGVHPIVSQFGGLLTDFAVGGSIGLAVIGGITAIVGVLASLGAANRKAREEMDKTTQSLVEQARATRAATVAGAEDLQLIQEMNLQRVKAEGSFGLRTILKGAITGNFSTAEGDAEAHAKRVADATTAVEQATINVGKAWEAVNKPVREVTKSVREFGAVTKHVLSLEELVSFPSRLTAMERALSSASIDAARETLLGDVVQPFEMPKIDIPTQAQIKAIREGTTHEDENAAAIKDAIWGSAIQGASIIVNALNIGGGGAGSSLGGALGSTAGFAAGFAFGGPIGGAIGSTLGTIGGSLIGGLFDNKKATDRNTDALNRVANLLNAPTGFKSAYYTYQAEDARRIYRNMEEEARRQGTRGGQTGFALRARG